MEVAWITLSALVKLLFALSPRMVRPEEFPLGEHEHWKEAKEVAAVSATRGMLASLPVVLAVQTFERADTLCKPFGIAALPAAIIAIVLSLLTYGLLRFPVQPLRGNVTPFIAVVLLVALESGYLYAGRDSSARNLCISAAASSVAPSGTSPSSASSTARTTP